MFGRVTLTSSIYSNHSGVSAVDAFVFQRSISSVQYRWIIISAAQYAAHRKGACSRSHSLARHPQYHVSHELFDTSDSRA